MKEVKTGTRKKGELSRSKKKARRAVYLAKCKAERKNFGNVIRNVMYLRMQRGRSKLIRILLVSIA